MLWAQIAPSYWRSVSWQMNSDFIEFRCCKICQMVDNCVILGLVTWFWRGWPTRWSSLQNLSISKMMPLIIMKLWFWREYRMHLPLFLVCDAMRNFKGTSFLYLKYKFYVYTSRSTLLVCCLYMYACINVMYFYFVCVCESLRPTVHNLTFLVDIKAIFSESTKCQHLTFTNLKLQQTKLLSNSWPGTSQFGGIC